MPFQVDMSKAHHKHPLEAWISFLLGMMLCVGPLLFGGGYFSGFLFHSTDSTHCLVLWCIILLRNSRYRLLWPPVCWPGLVFLSYGFWRYRFSDSLILAEDEVLRSQETKKWRDRTSSRWNSLITLPSDEQQQLGWPMLKDSETNDRAIGSCSASVARQTAR